MKFAYGYTLVTTNENCKFIPRRITLFHHRSFIPICYFERNLIPYFIESKRKLKFHLKTQLHKYFLSSKYKY